VNILRLSLISGFLIAVSLSTVANAQPKLVIPQTEFDFGFVPQSAKISHDFWLYSKGTDTLKILQVNPG
jgi:hypothetical protein